MHWGVDEEITEYVDGERLTVRLSNFAMPVKHAEAQMSLRVVDARSTEVTISMEYEMKFGPVGWVMNNMIMRPMMTNVLPCWSDCSLIGNGVKKSMRDPGEKNVAKSNEAGRTPTMVLGASLMVTVVPTTEGSPA